MLVSSHESQFVLSVSLRENGFSPKRLYHEEHEVNEGAVIVRRGVGQIFLQVLHGVHGPRCLVLPMNCSGFSLRLCVSARDKIFRFKAQIPTHERGLSGFPLLRSVVSRP